MQVGCGGRKKVIFREGVFGFVCLFCAFVFNKDLSTNTGGHFHLYKISNAHYVLSLKFSPNRSAVNITTLYNHNNAI